MIRNIALRRSGNIINVLLAMIMSEATLTYYLGKDGDDSPKHLGLIYLLVLHSTPLVLRKAMTP